jgi:hypothetical protein
LYILFDLFNLIISISSDELIDDSRQKSHDSDEEYATSKQSTIQYDEIWYVYIIILQTRL